MVFERDIQPLLEERKVFLQESVVDRIGVCIDEVSIDSLKIVFSR